MPTRILAWDFSGSTDSMAYYHTTGKSYVDRFRKDAANETDVKLKYLLWSESCIAVDPERLDEVIKRKTGSGGTYPSQIIRWVKDNISSGDNPVELWLITDGEIDRSELTHCAKLNQSMSYAKVKFIVINQRSIDMSVGASFMSDSAVEIYKNGIRFKTIQTAIPFLYDEITGDNFQTKWAELTDFIQAKFMGSDRDALIESEKLGLLRKRLLKELEEVESTNDKDTVKPILFKSKKKDDLIRDLKTCQFYRTLTNSGLKDTRSQIDGMVSSLINYIHNTHKSFDFNEIKMDFKTEQIKTVEEEPTLDTLENIEQCKFYDAVTLDDELAQPILLLGVTDLITKYWENGSYSKFRAVIDCPLFATLDGCTGHVFSLETFKSLRDNHHGDGDSDDEEDERFLINPMTREKVVGGLIFSTTAEADSWNDYVLAHTFFRGKKVCPDFCFWYYVIWKHFENAEWIEPEILNKLHIYAFRRLESAKVRLALSTLPLDPKEKVSIPVACFYCTEGSSRLFGQDKQLFAHERLRMYSGVAHKMIEILDYFGYTDFDRDFIRNRAKILSIVGELKRIPQVVEKRYHLASKVFKRTADARFLTYELKNTEAIRYFDLLQYSHKEMIPFDLHLNSDWCRVLEDHVLLAYEYEALTQINLCMQTYRPYFVDYDESGNQVSNYAQILKCVSDVTLKSRRRDCPDDLNYSKAELLDQSRLVSEFKWYINLTEELKRFPTLDELMDYVAKVKKFKGQRLVFLFPPNVCEIIENAHKAYSTLVNATEVATFLKAAKNAVSVMNRVKAEERIKSEVETVKFISKAMQLLGKD